MLGEAFLESPADLALDRTRDSIPGWDSMGALTLIAEIDERFGIELSAEESRRMACVADALDFLRKHELLAD